MSRLGCCLCPLLLFGLVLWAPLAQAWGASGHRLIALGAWQLLFQPTRERLTDLLRAHPRFQEDFLGRLPPGLSGAGERSAWLFTQAAVWPDLARKLPAYDRPQWHYVNIPVRIGSAARGPAEQCQIERASPVGTHLPQALTRQLSRLNDASVPAAERAVALSWVLHLVADAHQPLHSVAMFDAHRYRRGDRGGNELRVVSRGNLHRVWDSLLDRQGGFSRQAAARLRRSHLQRLRRAAPELGVTEWLEQSCQVALEGAYAGDVRAALLAPNRRGVETPIRLGRSYLERAADQAEARAVEAMSRLAGLLHCL